MIKSFALCIATIFCGPLSGMTQSSNNEIEIPTELLSQLKRDDLEIRNTFRNGYDPTDMSQRVSCELVDLNGDKKPEYVLSQLGGNSSAPIWIYRRTARGFQQLLKAAFMNYVVLKPSTNGYNDLKMTYGGNSMGYNADIYKFNGRKYVLLSRAHKRGATEVR